LINRCGKQIGSYLGLIPSEESSARRQRLGHISKQGNALLRFLLIEAAQAATRSNPAWRREFLHLALRRGRQIATVALARKLAVRLYWMWRNGWDYETDGRWIRVLTVVDQYTRECLTLFADVALSGEKVASALDKVVALRGAPKSITVDNGTEFASKAMDHWAYLNGVHLDFIRPGRPVENGYIESFNGRLRDEC
jgi:transposase InsO family protein